MEASALDRVLGSLHSPVGHWVRLVGEDEFRLLTCSQASPQLLSLLLHASKKNVSAQDVLAIEALMQGVRETMAGKQHPRMGCLASPAPVAQSRQLLSKDEAVASALLAGWGMQAFASPPNESSETCARDPYGAEASPDHGGGGSPR